MIYNQILRPIGACCEARGANSVSLVKRVLVEDAAFVVLTPVLGIRGICTNKLELPMAIVAVI
jgi:hypothetical protein